MVSFPRCGPREPPLDTIVAWNDEGRRSGVLVNTGVWTQTVTVRDWDQGLHGCAKILRLDESTGNRVVQEPFSGTIALNGHGIAVVSSQPAEIE